MPRFEIFSMLQWLHYAAMSIGAGSAVAALLLSGYEETREDLQGIAAALWAKLCTWSFRLAFLLGIVLLAVRWQTSGNPFNTDMHLHWKLPMVVLLLVMSEMSPKALATGKRGAPLLALVLFLMASFVAFNRGAFDKPLATEGARPAVMTQVR